MLVINVTKTLIDSESIRPVTKNHLKVLTRKLQGQYNIFKKGTQDQFDG